MDLYTGRQRDQFIGYSQRRQGHLERDVPAGFLGRTLLASTMYQFTLLPNWVSGILGE